jgi:hypothetical protein
MKTRSTGSGTTTDTRTKRTDEDLGTAALQERGSVPL